jgi:nicotinamide-nucleotide amidase
MKKTDGKAAILAIGTELTTGQVLNRNSAWLSEQLVTLGLEVVLHETVPDDRELILEALEHAKKLSQFLFVTGGLGPTTDDFTRTVVSDWLEQPLEFSEAIWVQIQARLSQLRLPIAASNRQQCYFPRYADILPNPAGTAPGFSCSIHGSHRRIWVLPGPPHEVEAVWKTQAEALLLANIPKREPLRLLTWQCLGKTEAELGELTEHCLKGSGLKTGYRAHRPYVEIKVWCPEPELTSKQSWIQKLESTLQPWILTRQGEDLAERLIHSFDRDLEVSILDSCTEGLLSDRLSKTLRKQQQGRGSTAALTMVQPTFVTEWDNPSDPEAWLSDVLEQASDPDTLTLVLGGLHSGQAWIGLREGSRIQKEKLESPYAQKDWKERAQAFIVEKALKRWCDWLDQATS